MTRSPARMRDLYARKSGALILPRPMERLYCSVQGVGSLDSA